MSFQNKIDLDTYKFIIETLTKSDDLTVMGSQLTSMLIGATGAKGATLFIINTEKEELEILATEGLSSAYVNKGPILVDQSMKHESNRTPVIIIDTQKSDILQYPDKAEEEGVRTIVSLPINIRGKVIGALRIYHSTVWEPSEEDLSFLQVLTHNVGMALMYFRLSTTVLEIKESVNDIHAIWL
ncbi:GAF domain-containing protein [uncultured Desulfobacter sp.]|uniref:GAF domain-containing protein n=1 Tax=uncultured Desulfobacter sp. TaxID=240139 RepID=UPI0029F47923|nr:GAF domain-containing protein [uncultured Desulfobacter sp.]